MYPKTIAWQGKLPCPPQSDDLNKDMLFLKMIYSMSWELKKNPQIYLTDKNTLWVYFQNSWLTCSDIFSKFGISAALVSQEYPISIYGGLRNHETGELSCELAATKKDVFIKKFNISGTDFEGVTNVCLKIQIASENWAEEMLEIFSAIEYNDELATVKRTLLSEAAFNNTDEINGDTYYRYIPLFEELDSYSSICSLSIKQQKKLWLLLLEDGISSLEFDYLLRDLEKRDSFDAFPWQLSLTLALKESGVKITREDNIFYMWQKDGKRIMYSYESGTPAQKLFLKFYFLSAMSDHSLDEVQ